MDNGTVYCVWFGELNNCEYYMPNIDGDIQILRFFDQVLWYGGPILDFFIKFMDYELIKLSTHY